VSIDSVCGRLVLDIEGALASVVIDIASTASIGGFARGRRRSVIDRPQALVDLVRATSPFRVAKALGMIETQQDGEFREVHVATMAQHHFVTLIVLTVTHTASGNAALRQTCSPSDALVEVLRQVENVSSDAGTMFIGEQAAPNGVILVERNRVCWAAASGLSKRLTDILRGWADGSVDTDALEEVYRRCRIDNVPLGEALVHRGLLSAERMRAAMRQHTAESLIAMDRGYADAGVREWPVTWVKRSRVGYSPRFTFTTAEVLACVGALLSAARSVASLTGHLMDLRGTGSSAIAFRVVGPDRPVIVANSTTISLTIGEVFELAGWAAAALGASSGFHPDLLRSTVGSAAGGAVAWRGVGMDVCAPR